MRSSKILTEGDRRFLKKAMGFLNVSAIKIGWSDSTKKWPDLWAFPSERPPRIVVTKEWRKQNTAERRKRLVHEFLHLKGLQHGKYGKLVYDTKPTHDTFSVKVYRDLIRIME